MLGDDGERCHGNLLWFVGFQSAVCGVAEKLGQG
jgi:hypothetical protein